MRWWSRLGPLVLAVAVVACGTPRGNAAGAASSSATTVTVASAWPELPRTAAAAEALIQARTLRDAAEIAPHAASAEGVLEGLAERPEALLAGEPAIVARVQAVLDRAGAEGRDSVVLFGTFHDSGGQIDAFRRLIGPLGLRGLTRVAVEQLPADGAWKGVTPELQRGEDAALTAYLASGDSGALEALARRHATTDYAAWKFGYEASVLDLFITARAAGIHLTGCDIPASTQALLADVPERARLRLRELHCLFSLAPAAAGPQRTALLWGQAHVEHDALQRFLPPSTAVLAIHALGGRSGEWTTEGTLAPRLALTDALLLPLEGDETAVTVLYPEGALAASVDRARAEPASGEPGLHVRTEGGTGTLHLGERSFPVGPDFTRIEAPARESAYVLAVGNMKFAGAIHLPPGGGVDLTFNAAQRSLLLIERPAPR
jgi:hypothetical protein